jgi:DNA helicase-2/ATP-dependent DNA helicase PcrA
MHGVDSYGAPSRFIAEIPAELIEEVRPRVQVTRPTYTPGRPSTYGQTRTPAPAQKFFDEVPGGLKLGQRVRHQKFGDGVVLGLEGQGSNARVQVNFERQGSKWLMLGYANLEVV